MTPELLLGGGLFALLGALLGVAHFQGLQRDARRYLARGLGVRVVAAHAARLLATTAVLVFVARRGLWPLLAASSGFLVARFVVVHREWRAA
jgi:F1F0 ATPase subunit 2